MKRVLNRLSSPRRAVRSAPGILGGRAADPWGSRLIKIVVVIFCMVFLVPVLATAAILQASLDSNVVEMGDEIRLVVKIEGAQLVSEPEIPPRGNFEVVGRYSSTEMSIYNGQMQASRIYTYVLAPIKPGKFDIGPIAVVADGQRLHSEILQVEVVTQGVVPKQKTTPPQIPNMQQFPQMQQVPTLPQYNNSESDNKRSVFLEATVSNDKPYLGESIVMSVRLVSALRILQGNIEPFSFTDFIVEELSKDKEYYQEINGLRYAVHEVKYLLTPTKLGALSIDPIQARVEIQDLNQWFNDPTARAFTGFTRTKRLASQQLNIQVQELPPAPPEFTGLVGNFSIHAELLQNQINLGDTATLHVTLEGEGNIRDAVIPKLPVISALKVYEDKPKVDVKKTTQGFKGRKSYKFALVGQNPANVEIPPFKMAYFSSQDKNYHQIATDALYLKILGNGVTEQLVSAGIDKNENVQEVESHQDIRSLLTSERVLKKSWLQSRLASGLALVIIWIIPLFYFSWLLGSKLKHKWQRDEVARKSSKAFAIAKTNLKKLDLKNASISIILVELIRNYFGNRLKMDAGHLTTLELTALIQQKSSDPNLHERFKQVMEQLEYAKFSGSGSILGADTLKKQVMELLKQLEKSL